MTSNPARRATSVPSSRAGTLPVPDLRRRRASRRRSAATACSLSGRGNDTAREGPGAGGRVGLARTGPGAASAWSVASGLSPVGPAGRASPSSATSCSASVMEGVSRWGRASPSAPSPSKVAAGVGPSAAASGGCRPGAASDTGTGSASGSRSGADMGVGRGAWAVGSRPAPPVRYRLRPNFSWLDTQSFDEIAEASETSPASTTPAMISASLWTPPLP